MLKIVEKPAFRILVIVCLLVALVRVSRAEELPDTLLRESTDIGNGPCAYKGHQYQCYLVTHKGRQYVVITKGQPQYVLEVKGRTVTEVWFHPDLTI